MDSYGAMMGPRPASSSLEALRGADTLAAYIGVCPTCLGWADPDATYDECAPADGRAVCPTCGESSVEWDLAAEIDRQLVRMNRLDALDAAVRQGGDAPA